MNSGETMEPEGGQAGRLATGSCPGHYGPDVTGTASATHLEFLARVRARIHLNLKWRPWAARLPVPQQRRNQSNRVLDAYWPEAAPRRVPGRRPGTRRLRRGWFSGGRAAVSPAIRSESSNNLKPIFNLPSRQRAVTLPGEITAAATARARRLAPPAATSQRNTAQHPSRTSAAAPDTARGRASPIPSQISPNAPGAAQGPCATARPNRATTHGPARPGP